MGELVEVCQIVLRGRDVLVSVIVVAETVLRDVGVVLISGEGGPPGDGHPRLVGDVGRSSVDCSVSSQILSIGMLSLT